MTRKLTTKKGRRAAANGRAKQPRQETIAAAISTLEQQQPATAEAAKAIALFKTWLADESGYDEKVWPRLKKALEQERKRAGARSLFDA